MERLRKDVLVLKDKMSYMYIHVWIYMYEITDVWVLNSGKFIYDVAIT